MRFGRTLRHLTAAGVAAGLALGLSATAQAQDYNIKVAFMGSIEDEDDDGSLVFKDFVESHSNGKIGVEIFPAAQLCGNFRECMESVSSGVIEVTISTIGGFGNIYPPAQVLDLPYMFRDDRVAECVFDGPFVGQLRKSVLETVPNLRLMTISNTGGWRNFMTTNKLVKSPKDVEGLKIRTIPAEIQIELVKLLGGNPTPIAWPEVYTSLATGVAEGTKNGITDIVNMKFHEHLRYATLDGHAYMAALWWMNDALLMSMPMELRQVVHDGFMHLRTVTRALPMRKSIEAYEEFKKAGGTVYVPTAAEKAEFQKTSAPLKKWYTDKYGNEWLDKLQTAIGDCEQKVDAEYAELQ